MLKEVPVQALRVAAAVLLLAGATYTSTTVEHRDSAKDIVWSAAMPGPVYLVPAWMARALSLGHPTLAADYYWMGALQYYGRPLNVLTAYKDLHRYIDRVNALDPDFHYAYRFGGVSVPWNRGHWRWANVPASNAILERGLERFPGDWFMWMQLGFNRGILGTDYKGAADAYRHAAAAKGSPPWLSALVTRLLATTGAVDAAETYARTVLANTRDPRIRAGMQHRLQELRSQTNLDRIQAAIDQYRQLHGAPPASIEDLVKEGLLARVPSNPLGGTYAIVHGRAYATSLRRGRLHVFTVPK